MRYFKSINLFVGVILGYISHKAFHWECCYLWCLSLIQAFSISFSMKEVFISSLLSNKQLFFISCRISLQALRCFHKPTTSLFVSLLVFQQLRSILLCKDAFQADLWYKLAFSSPFFYFNNLSSILSSRRHCDVALFSHHLVLSRSCSFPCLSI